MYNVQVGLKLFKNLKASKTNFEHSIVFNLLERQIDGDWNQKRGVTDKMGGYNYKRATSRKNYRNVINVEAFEKKGELK